MSRRVELEEGALRDPENLALLNDPDITLLCSRCGATLEILRLGAGPKDALGRHPVHLVRCPTNEAHFCVSFHHRLPEMDRILRGEGADEPE